jgi:uncharacterized protein (DUF3820 family)
MAHIDTTGVVLPFGKYLGRSLPEVPSSYLRWCASQDWFEERYSNLADMVDAEIRWRDETGGNWEED